MIKCKSENVALYIDIKMSEDNLPYKCQVTSKQS